MDDVLRIYIKSAIEEKANNALKEFNHAIDIELDDGKVKSAASEYSRRRKMLNAFEEFCEKLGES